MAEHYRKARVVEQGYCHMRPGPDITEMMSVKEQSQFGTALAAMSQ